MRSLNVNPNVVGPFANYIAASYSLFQHDPLDLSQQSLRLVHVLPDVTHHGRIQCRLWHTTTSTEEYKCISYTWGADTNMYAININGRGFAVRENLWRFLNAARLCLPRKALWIDALCINQDAIGERNHQVQQMGPIYMNAQLTIVWISEMSNVLRLLQNDTRTAENSSESSCLAEIQDGLAVLCSNDYWRRVWVIQELLLAKELVLMSEASLLSWTTFSHFILGKPTATAQFSVTDFGIRSQQQIKDSWSAKLAKMRVASSGQMHEHSLFDLLRNFGQSECSDVRDRVLGLLGLTYDCGPETFQLVDYSQDVVKLFGLVMKFCTSGASFLSDARALVQGSNLTRYQLAQIVANLPSFNTKTTSLQNITKSDKNHLSCEHCQTLLVFRSFQNPTRSNLPNSWFEKNYNENDAAQRYTVSGSPLSDNCCRKDISVCCLADHGFDVHLVFEETTSTSHDLLYSVYHGSSQGVFLPEHNRYSDQSLSIVKKSGFSLVQSIKGAATELKGDTLARCFFMFGVPSQLPVVRRFLLDEDTQEQDDDILNQKSLSFTSQRPLQPSMPWNQDHSQHNFDSIALHFDSEWEVRNKIFSRDLRLVEDFACKASENSYTPNQPGSREYQTPRLYTM